MEERGWALMARKSKDASVFTITPEEAARLADSIMWHFYDADEMARFMLPIHAFVYGTTDRESMLTDIVEKAALFLPSVDGAVKADVSNVLSALRKGGCQVNNDQHK